MSAPSTIYRKSLKPAPKKDPSEHLPIPTQLIERRIYVIRGQKVMLDADLAELYQVLTKNLNKAVKRNIDRFPEDTAFGNCTLCRDPPASGFSS